MSVPSAVADGVGTEYQPQRRHTPSATADGTDRKSEPPERRDSTLCAHHEHDFTKSASVIQG